MSASGPNRHSAADRRSATPAPGTPVPSTPAVVETRYGTSMKFTIPSDHAHSQDVQNRILAEVKKFKYNSDSQFAIKLALEEGVVNAIKHGNKLDPNKTVYIEALVGPGQAEIIIEDEGPGFERTSVPDPTEPHNLEKSSGRGILLIEAYMTSVTWTQNGRRMHMIKRND